MDCVFCKIINGDIPSYTIYENDYVKCFLDINPHSKAHTLVVPKKHILDNNDIDEIYLNEVHKATKIVAEKISKAYKIDGYRLIQNNGILEEVKHYHMHIITNIKNDDETIEEVYNKIMNS